MARNTLSALFSLALAWGCSSPRIPGPMAPRVPSLLASGPDGSLGSGALDASGDGHPSASAARDPELSGWNREARAGAVTETLHGLSVSDPFRALESESPTTRRWIDHQTARSAAYLGAHARSSMPQRLRALLSIGVLRSPSTAGNRVFFLRREGAREQLSLMVSERVTGRPLAPAPDALWTAPRELVDPAGYGARGAIDWYSPSPRGSFVAFGISQNGDERSTLYVLDTRSGRLLEESIGHAKWCRLSWLPEESGFYYTRYPREGEEGYDAAEPDAYWRRMFFHRLVNRGRPPRAPATVTVCPSPRPDCAVPSDAARGEGDPLVFAGSSRTDAPSPWVSSDGRWLVVNLFVGWSRQDAFLIDRRLPAPRGTRPRVFTIATGADLNTAMVHGDRVYVVSNRGAPKYRVVSVDAASLTVVQDPHRTPGPAAPTLTEALMEPWHTVIPEGAHPMDEVLLANGRIVVASLENIASRVRVHALSGELQSEIVLPGEGTVSGIDASADSPTVALVYESFFTPPVLLAAELTESPARSGGILQISPARVDEVRSDFDASRYVMERQSVPSRDGTPVNVFYIHRRDWRRDGREAVLLTGYGGFNISLTPSFTRDPLYWLERGGVYAVANLRGGAEFGERWHQDGALANKVHVFEDFEAVIRWFGEGGVSNPSRIAIRGGSNGGLLMGAMLTRAPETFRATVARVGLYDMLRFHRFPPAEIWTSEYGSPEDPESLRYLYAYSPYHRVREGVFPAAWIETADHDSRVYWAHSTKFAALLQESQTGPLPIYFFMQQNVGHGAGTRLGDQVDRYVREYSFLEDQLGLGAEGPSP